MAIPVTAIFDIGKTNKKFFLFNEDLQEVYHEYQKLPLTEDEDGFACDDLPGLTSWIKETVSKLLSSPEYRLQGVNFSTYGATLVHLGEDGKPLTALYNYLKPFPEETLKEFNNKYHGEANDVETASPCLGMLNSGLQLYWLKKHKPEVFKKIRHTLHFPQYLSYLFTGELVSEPTSIGCHTKLWDFSKGDYHAWVKEEGLAHLFPQLVPTTYSKDVRMGNTTVKVGVGIHDSSSALASYMLRADDEFLLVSTGTWSITLNPFTQDDLTIDELKRDCLNYLTIQGKPVKASRLFLGNELDHQVKELNRIFNKEARHYKEISLSPEFFKAIQQGTIKPLFKSSTIDNPVLTGEVLPSTTWNPSELASYEEAYHHVIWGLALLQVASIKLAAGRSSGKKIFVDGGFIDNDIYIKLLKYYLPDCTIEVSHLPLGSAYGAAIVLQKGAVQKTVGISI